MRNRHRSIILGMLRVLLIANPISGRGRAKEIAPKLAEKLGEAGIASEVYFTSQKGDAGRRAAQVDEKFDLVVGIGGDGTLSEILNGLPKKVPVSLFPMGTANVLALELDLPRVAVDFVELARKGRLRDIDLIRANGKLGFFALGVGFDGMVIESLQQKRHGAISKSSYIPIVIDCLKRYRTPQLKVTVDGKIYENVSFALIANTLNYGGSVFQLSPDRKLDDGLYECYLFQGRGRWSLFKYLLRGLTHRLIGKNDPIVVQGKKIRVESQIPDYQVPYEMDGDFGGLTPVDIEVVPKGMQVLVK